MDNLVLDQFFSLFKKKAMAKSANESLEECLVNFFVDRGIKVDNFLQTNKVELNTGVSSDCHLDIDQLGLHFELEVFEVAKDIEFKIVHINSNQKMFKIRRSH